MPRADTHVRLSPTSFVVLGTLSLFGGEATPYQIKRLLSSTLTWDFAHSQLYAEPGRLAKAGYVTVSEEQNGRRRKIYKITRKGRAALAQWRAEPLDEGCEFRDLALIKLFFGADPAAHAKRQAEILRAEIRRIEEIKNLWEPVAPKGPLRAADYGLKMRRAALAFWSELAGGR
jgi:PadR family transcriptional regulator AphA